MIAILSVLVWLAVLGVIVLLLWWPHRDDPPDDFDDR